MSKMGWVYSDKVTAGGHVARCSAISLGIQSPTNLHPGPGHTGTGPESRGLFISKTSGPAVCAGPALEAEELLGGNFERHLGKNLGQNLKRHLG